MNNTIKRIAITAGAIVTAVYVLPVWGRWCDRMLSKIFNFKVSDGNLIIYFLAGVIGTMAIFTVITIVIKWWEWVKYSQDIYDYFEKCYNDTENVAFRNNIKPVPSFDELKESVYYYLLSTSIDSYVFIYNLKDEIMQTLGVKSAVFVKIIDALHKDGKLKDLTYKEVTQIPKLFPGMVVTAKLSQ